MGKENRSVDRSGSVLGGRYRLGAKIGTGGMSDVYAATDDLLGRDVAVKMMHPELARDHSFLERFKREAQNAAKLNHPAIVAVYDTGETDTPMGSIPFIVMERVHGETLREIVQDGQKMRVTDAAAVMSQVAEALRFSHEAGIIHRDIKPANIMITNAGAVKVMDFGIARALSDASAAMTQTSAILGTAQYLSPEQAQGVRADSRTDIYSAGCVFYELVTGQPPFRGDSPFAVAAQHLHNEPVPPSQVPQMALSPREALSLDAVTAKAMAKDPAQRYLQAEDFATDLKRLAENQMPLIAQVRGARAVSGALDPDATNVLNRQALASATGAAPGLIAATAGTVSPAQATPGVQHDAIGANGADDDVEYVEYYEEEAERSGGGWLKAVAAIAALAALGGAGYVGYSMMRDDTAATTTAAPSTAPVAEQVVVPNVANQKQNAAEKALQDKGFQTITEETNDPKVPRGSVIRTMPQAGAPAPRGSAVTVTVSLGKESIEVPDVTGKTEAEARRILQDSKLTAEPEIRHANDDQIDAGKIVRQEPAPGVQTTQGGRITLTISDGKAKVVVPSLSGKKRDDVEKQFSNFKPEYVEVDSTRPKGTIVSISHEGEELPKDSTIRVEISKGNQFVMPNLVNRTATEALAALQQAGWSGSYDDLRQVPFNTTDFNRLERVAQQSPQAGQSVSKNEPIELQINKFSLLPNPR